jgi:chlorobactene glucosyltransferase
VPDWFASLHLEAVLEAIRDTGPEVWAALALAVVIAVLFLRARAHQLSLPKLPRPATFRKKGRGNKTPPDAPPSPGDLPDCMVVIPARNEAAYIGRAVRSLPHDSVIVVDDHSEDATAAEARKAGAGVIRAAGLSRAVSGKSNACMTGARALTSKWILFADADTRFEPGFLDAAIGYAESSGIALLSVYLDPEYPTAGEALLAPYLIALYFCGANPVGTVAAFNGQCVFVRRDAYEFLGGHAAVLNTWNEDVRFAAIAQRHRLKFGIVRANGMGTVLWRELSGNVHRGAVRFMILSPGRGATILITALAMAAWIPVFAWLWMEHHYRAAAVFAAVPWLLLWRWYGRGWRSGTAVTLPIAIYAVLPMLIGGVWNALGGGAVKWKGRSI